MGDYFPLLAELSAHRARESPNNESTRGTTHRDFATLLAGPEGCAALQRQKAVTAYFKSKQLLHFGFARLLRNALHDRMDKGAGDPNPLQAGHKSDLWICAIIGEAGAMTYAWEVDPLQRKKAVTAYFAGKLLVPFGFVRQIESHLVKENQVYWT